ncbi:unnamed protein product [Schistosoma mattheei]|uniref:Uncharacterized protein n=1 Tax=Schistosoma mattheei TaxID=31246 RepID=A0A3P8BDN2_9TREM|nr:unnamed protein product [Schistosoma mattheei]
MLLLLPYTRQGYSCDESRNGGRCAVGSNISSRGVGGGSYAQMYGQATPYTSNGRGVPLCDGYVTDPYQMASISQQMGGMMLFEPGLSTVSQQNFVFQVRDCTIVAIIIFIPYPQ